MKPKPSQTTAKPLIFKKPEKPTQTLIFKKLQITKPAPSPTTTFTCGSFLNRHQIRS